VRWIAAKFGELLCGENRVGERGEMGRGRCSGARLCPLEADARGGENRGSWARASARRFEAERERENGRAVGGDRADRQPGLSAGGRERGRGRCPAGPRPRKRGEGAGFWAKRPKEKREGEKGFFLFIFPKQIFKLFFKM